MSTSTAKMRTRAAKPDDALSGFLLGYDGSTGPYWCTANALLSLSARNALNKKPNYSN